LHSAINERQPEDLETQIDDDVDWVIYGPIELFPFLGARRGKAAVLEVCRQISENVRVHCSIASRSCWARILKQTRRFQRAPRIGVRRRRRAIAREPRYLSVARRWPGDLFPGRQRIEDALLRAGLGTAASRNTGLRRCRRTRLRGGRRNGDRLVMLDVHLDGDVLV